MSTAFVVGYDPGGKGAHGVAVLEVQSQHGCWEGVSLMVTVAPTLGSVVTWLEDTCRHGRIVAAGIDTLTEWNSGAGGWRPADSWLRKRYPSVASSVVSPNYLSGSMAVNGAAFLRLMAPRFGSDATMVTEAHPKVCYFAVSGQKHAWTDHKATMATWLGRELGVEISGEVLGDKDDCFDAGIAALAALRGVNGEWTLDLHGAGEDGEAGRVQFCGATHFWWPMG